MEPGRRNFRIRNERGSSPLEALVTASALLMSVVSTTDQAFSPRLTNTSPSYQAQAMTLARAKLEELRSMSSTATGGEDTPAPGFSREWTVEKVVAESRHFTTFVIGVSWPGASPSQKISLSWVTSRPLLFGAPTVLDDIFLLVRYSPFLWILTAFYLLFRGSPRRQSRRRQEPISSLPPSSRSSRHLPAEGQSRDTPSA